MRLLALNLLLLTACAERPNSACDTIDYSFSYDPRSLDPALSTDVPTGELAALLFDDLTQFDVNARLVPGSPGPGRRTRAGLVTPFTCAAVPPSTMVGP